MLLLLLLCHSKLFILHTLFVIASFFPFFFKLSLYLSVYVRNHNLHQYLFLETTNVKFIFYKPRMFFTPTASTKTTLLYTHILRRLDLSFYNKSTFNNHIQYTNNTKRKMTLSPFILLYG